MIEQCAQEIRESEGFSEDDGERISELDEKEV